jgi:hypothetical protein
VAPVGPVGPAAFQLIAVSLWWHEEEIRRSPFCLTHPWIVELCFAPEVVLATASPAPATRIAPATAPAIVAPGRAANRIDNPRNPRPSFAPCIAPPVLPGKGRNRSGAIL